MKNLSPAELKGLKLRQTFVEKQEIFLYDFYTEEYNFDTETLGGYVTNLIPCLDPETPDYAKFRFDVVSQRTDMQDPRLQRLKQKMSAAELSTFEPYYWKFIPDAKVQEKLLMKMATLQDEEKELWQGFGISMEEARRVAEEIEARRKEQEEELNEGLG